MREGWKYYNHALIPTAAPHENVKNLMFDREFWKNTPGGGIRCLRDGRRILTVGMKQRGGM